MTIAGMYVTSDGVVLGADSTATVMHADGSYRYLNHAQKVFEIGADSCFGLAFVGSFGVGSRSQRSVAALLGERLKNLASPTVEALSKELASIVEKEHAAHPAAFPDNWHAGYLIGGIEKDRRPAGLSISFKMNSPVGAPPRIEPTVQPLAFPSYWFLGAPEHFSRLIQGFEPSLPALLEGAIEAKLRARGIDTAEFAMLFKEAFRDVASKIGTAPPADLPIRDAIDFIHAILYATIKGLKFRLLPAICGGPIELAYLTTDRKFRWAAHKTFASAIQENRSFE